MPNPNFSGSYFDSTTNTDSINEAKLDSLKTAIEDFFNTTKLASDNIQTGGIPASKIKTSAMTTNKFANASLSTANLADSIIEASDITNSVLTKGKFATPLITTDGSDPGAGGICTYAYGTVISPQTIGAGSWATVFEMTLTTTGRAIMIGAKADYNSSMQEILTHRTGTISSGAKIRLVRSLGVTDTVVYNPDGFPIGGTSTETWGDSPNGGAFSTFIGFMDIGIAGTAGTYIYKFQVQNTTGAAVTAGGTIYTVPCLMEV